MAEEELMSIWDEIDRAESCLVCCQFDEAASQASSILGRLIEKCSPSNRGGEISKDYEKEWDDMVESAGMVLVQSMTQLRRTSEMLKELKLIFGSLTAIPIQVFIAGVCFQIAQNTSPIVQGYLEEFLNNWRYVDGHYYPLLDTEATAAEKTLCRFSIGTDEYLEVVDLYVIKHLAITLKDINRAISWVEKATLPMEKHEELLRQLNSMNSSVVTCSSQSSIPQQTNGYRSNLPQDQKLCNGQQGDIASRHISSKQKTAKDEILKLSQQKVSYLQWFPIFSFKLGNTRIVIPNRKMLLVSFVLLIYYFTRKKHAALKRSVIEKAMSVKRGLVDLWQLAFSYQVNPLAAVQGLPNN